MSERHRPTSLRQVIGNGEAVRALSTWADDWGRSGTTPPRYRAALLVGPPGVGKTTAALAVAADHGWTVVEMNASDARNQGAIENVAGRASITNSLGGSETYTSARAGARTLILLDEADSLSGRASEEPARRRTPVAFRDFLRTRYGSLEALAAAWGLGRPGAPAAFSDWTALPAAAGRAAWTRLPAAQRDIGEWKDGERPRDSGDRGGLGAIARLVRETRQPLLLTVNDPQPLTRYSPIFRQAVRRIEFTPLARADLRTLVRRLTVAEEFTLPAAAIDRILERAAGDVRAALNDLEAIAPLGADVDLASLLGDRDRGAGIEEFLEEVVASPAFRRSTEISNRLVDVSPDELLPWVEEVVVRSPASPERRARAVAHLATADRFVARGRRQRVFSQWSYGSEAAVGGVALALGPRSRTEVATGFPAVLGAMGRSREARALRQRLLTKLGRAHHVSRRKGIESILPLYERLLRPTAPPNEASARLGRRLVQDADLDPEEIGFLVGAEPESERVLDLLAPIPPEPAPPSPPEPTGPAEDESGAVRRRRQRQLGEF